MDIFSVSWLIEARSGTVDAQIIYNLLFPSTIAGHVPSIFMAHLIYLTGDSFFVWMGNRLPVARPTGQLHQFMLPRIFSGSYGKSGGTIEQIHFDPTSLFFFLPRSSYSSSPWPAPTFLRAAFALLPPVCFPVPPAGRHPRIILLPHDSGPSGRIEVVVRPP